MTVGAIGVRSGLRSFRASGGKRNCGELRMEG
jgi:hypothetical protein